ncbi:RidA family protein [Hydrogenophaga sp. BPS33]|uniref:RidA family protein n=1 Tax=Hydrogenophaga sp. BPS33 TaxID=2651974 RepID=UPI00131F659F|nr:RidA family protein [Hydrogenophaga sp. BPS33]QHE87256.1 RidA family protein [Hydrogenophaga sp. BPS33]
MTRSQCIAPDTVAPPAGLYSHAVLTHGTGRWLHIAGQIGTDRAGQLAQGFEAQAHQAWTNLVGVLQAAGMEVSDLVKVTTYLTDATDLPKLGAVRAGYLGSARPASTLVVAAALAHPDWCFEVEAIAFRPD